MVAKISFGSSLYGALAYNGEKINKEEGKLLATNKIFDDCSGKTSIANALRDFQRYLSPHIRTEKPVVHISLNPHPDDVLTDIEMENIAREYLERMGYGNQPYMVYKHEDIDRHHMHIVTSEWMKTASVWIADTTTIRARLSLVTWSRSTISTKQTASNVDSTIRSVRWM